MRWWPGLDEKALALEGPGRGKLPTVGGSAAPAESGTAATEDRRRRRTAPSRVRHPADRRRLAVREAARQRPIPDRGDRCSQRRRRCARPHRPVRNDDTVAAAVNDSIVECSHIRRARRPRKPDSVAALLDCLRARFWKMAQHPSSADVATRSNRSSTSVPLRPGSTSKSPGTE